MERHLSKHEEMTKCTTNFTEVEYYTELYRMSEAERAMQFADSVVFMGTSFSVNITSIALRYALSNNARIEIVDPHPIDLNISCVEYHKMTASEYISEFDRV